MEHMVQFGDAAPWEWAPAAVLGPRQAGRWPLPAVGTAVLVLLPHGPGWQPGTPAPLQDKSFPVDGTFPRALSKSSFTSSGFM